MGDTWVWDGTNWSQGDVELYTISGQVTDGGGNPLSGVNVSDNVGHNSTSASNGNYVLYPLLPGTYTVTPAKSGYSFSPPSISVTVPPNATGQNFTATQLTYSIAGKVTDGSGNPLSGVNVSDNVGHNITTASNGNYVLNPLLPGTYTITPAKSGYTFSPPSISVTVPPNATEQNFTATQLTYSIAGKVTDGSGNPLSGVNVSDNVGHNITTASNGNYVLNPLLPGTYTVTPAKSGYTFSPPSISVTVPPDATEQNFTATQLTYSIAGKVTDGSGNPLSGVNISDNVGHNITTASNGNYVLNPLLPGTYTVTPTKSGYTFSPPSRSVTVPPDAMGRDFASTPAGTPTPPRLRLLYVPLRWGNSQASFDAEAETQSDIFIDDVLLRGCRDRVLVETLDVASQNFDTFTCSPSNCAVGSIRTFVRDELEIDPADYDVIVGLGETSPCAPIAGCSNGTDTIWVTAAYDSVTAHELGHIYGLEDEYCSNQAGSADSRCNDGDGQGDGALTGDVNWLDASLPCDCAADGSNDSSGSPCCNFAGNDCAVVDYGICCQGNKNAAGGRSTMSYADAAGPRGFDSHDKAHLNALTSLNCGSPSNATGFALGGLLEEGSQTVLDVNLRVRQNDSVHEESILITEGMPTPDSVLQGMTGDYSLEITKASGETLWTQAFALYFDYTGPVVLGADYSGISYDEVAVEFRIPYQCEMRVLDLYHGGTLVFSKTLPARCLVYLPLVLRGN